MVLSNAFNFLSTVKNSNIRNFYSLVMEFISFVFKNQVSHMDLIIFAG